MLFGEQVPAARSELMNRSSLCLAAGLLVVLLSVASQATRLAAQTTRPPGGPVGPPESSLENLPASAPADLALSFRRPPRITHVSVPNKFEFRSSDYLFTIDLPADAVARLERLVFEQIEGFGYPRYATDRTHVFEAGDRSAQLPLSSVENNTDERSISLEFDPPVEPGRQITVALRARRNPREGTFIYRLTAYPEGSLEGQYAGIGRLNFYDLSDRRDRWP